MASGLLSVISLVKLIFSFNIFTLVSWISVVGISFKFLRKEYLIWSRSGVMDIEDEGDIFPLLRDKNAKPRKCPECGQPAPRHTLPRPKILCTKAVFFMYIILIAVILVMICCVAAGAVVFPVYSIYVSPYLPTQHNMNKVSVVESHNVEQLAKDTFVHHNFTTEVIAIPDNYRSLLNITVVNGIEAYSSCNSYLSDYSGIMTLVQDFQDFSANREKFVSTLPSVSMVLSGLNATFGAYLEYLPTDVPLIHDMIDYFHIGNYTLATLQDFIEKHNIFAFDIMQLRIIDIVNIIQNPRSVFQAVFLDDLEKITAELKKNVTDVGTDIISKSTEAYNRGYAIIMGFVSGEDLHKFAEIPAEYVEMFSLIQSKFIYYKDIIVNLMGAFPEFFACLVDEGADRANRLMNTAFGLYFKYFKVHFMYTLFAVVVIVALIVLLVLMIIKGIALAKETMEYCKSLITEEAEETMSAINDFGKAVKN